MKIVLYLLAVTLLTLSACEEFLEKKPDIKLVVPKTLDDADLLLNNYNSLNMYYPVFGEIGTDDYYLTHNNWEAVSNYEQRLILDFL